MQTEAVESAHSSHLLHMFGWAYLHHDDHIVHLDHPDVFPKAIVAPLKYINLRALVAGSV
jgi:hypothetical protein